MRARSAAAAVAVGALVGAAGCSGTAASSRPTGHIPAPSVTTVPGSRGDPLSAPVRARAALGATGPSGASGGRTLVVRPPGATFLTPSQVADRPVAKVGAWVLAARTADNRFLLVDVGFGGCTELAALEVAVGPAAVTITPRLRSAPPGAICPALAVVADVVVDLGAPLGARVLVHPPPT